MLTAKKTDDGKNKAAVSLGRRGGIVRAERLTPAERLKIAKKAASTRWKKKGRPVSSDESS